MKLPSDNYFKHVKSYQTYNDFLATGMMFEVEPCAPSSWQEHLEMVEYKKQMEEGMNNSEFVEVSLKDVVEHFAEGFYNTKDSNKKYKLERYSVDQGKGTILFILQPEDKEVE